jgi:prepilin-type N-terminal cleavage/methylation domain-containing protein
MRVPGSPHRKTFPNSCAEGERRSGAGGVPQRARNGKTPVDTLFAVGRGRVPTVDQNLQVAHAMVPPRSGHAGFSLLELLVVLAIVLIAALIGAGTIQPYLPRFRMVSTAKSFRSDVRMLQTLALQTGRQTRLRLVPPSGSCSDPEEWGGGWVMELGDKSVGSTSWDILPPDALADGTDDDKSQGVFDLGPDGSNPARGICLKEWDTIEGPGAGNANALVFSARGSLANPVTDFPDGYIRLTFANQYAAREGIVDEVQVMISAAGWSGLESSLGQPVGDGSVGASLSSSAD